MCHSHLKFGWTWYTTQPISCWCQIMHMNTRRNYDDMICTDSSRHTENESHKSETHWNYSIYVKWMLTSIFYIFFSLKIKTFSALVGSVKYMSPWDTLHMCLNLIKMRFLEIELPGNHMQFHKHYRPTAACATHSYKLSLSFNGACTSEIYHCYHHFTFNWPILMI